MEEATHKNPWDEDSHALQIQLHTPVKTICQCWCRIEELTSKPSQTCALSKLGRVRVGLLSGGTKKQGKPFRLFASCMSHEVISFPCFAIFWSNTPGWRKSMVCQLQESSSCIILQVSFLIHCNLTNAPEKLMGELHLLCSYHRLPYAHL